MTKGTVPFGTVFLSNTEKQIIPIYMNLNGIIVGAAAFSCFWGIYEIFCQEKRVLRGWFPENPKRHDYYEKLRK
ncbi:MAG: DUF4491 family protein [Bacteroidaceae bacterium]|nr:DUF4491 family protein [Bacteroidaceae bacterium]